MANTYTICLLGIFHIIIIIYSSSSFLGCSSAQCKQFVRVFLFLFLLLWDTNTNILCQDVMGELVVVPRADNQAATPMSGTQSHPLSHLDSINSISFMFASPHCFFTFQEFSAMTKDCGNY
jgi:hypothetical protein